jgi:Fur family ferric uptake transcriptional regulator
MRLTPQRQLVLDAVRALTHATPEQICQRVQHTAPTVNLTTVYRALDLLERLGLVRHTHLGHGAPTYSADEHEHVHLVCHSCEQVYAVPRDLLDELATLLRSKRGFHLDRSHLALSGTCADCASGHSDAQGHSDAHDHPGAHDHSGAHDHADAADATYAQPEEQS